MQSRPAALTLRHARFTADLVERIEIVDPQTRTECARRRIEFRHREELDNQCATLQNHPAHVAPGFLEAEGAIEAGGCFEVAGGKVRGGNVCHARTIKRAASLDT
jgi:hypothetical protein